MKIQNEPIGSIPRSPQLIRAIMDFAGGNLSSDAMERLYDEAVADTIQKFEATGSSVVTDGEQRKQSFVTYPLNGLSNLSSDGVVIPFADGHTRQLPSLTKGPFHYGSYAAEDLKKAKKFTKKRMKQAVISASAISLIYPQKEIAGYSRDQFLQDLVREATNDIRQCLDAGVSVQIDFTEGRLAIKLDPSLGLLKSFIELNNRVLSNFTAAERAQIGVHTCPGGDHDSTHSADVNYSLLLPELFQLEVGNYFLQFKSERDKLATLRAVKPLVRDKKMVFFGVTDPISAKIETPEEVADVVQVISDYIPVENFGTTDDCGFAPFCDDISTTREQAFGKIRARVEGTALAEARLKL